MTEHEKEQEVIARGKRLHDEWAKRNKDSHDDVVLVLWIIGVLGVSSIVGMVAALFVTGA